MITGAWGDPLEAEVWVMRGLSNPFTDVVNTGLPTLSVVGRGQAKQTGCVDAKELARYYAEQLPYTACLAFMQPDGGLRGFIPPQETPRFWMQVPSFSYDDDVPALESYHFWIEHVKQYGFLRVVAVNPTPAQVVLLAMAMNDAEIRMRAAFVVENTEVFAQALELAPTEEDRVRVELLLGVLKRSNRRAVLDDPVFAGV